MHTNTSPLVRQHQQHLLPRTCCTPAVAMRAAAPSIKNALSKRPSKSNCGNEQQKGAREERVEGSNFSPLFLSPAGTPTKNYPRVFARKNRTLSPGHFLSSLLLFRHTSSSSERKRWEI